MKNSIDIHKLLETLSDILSEQYGVEIAITARLKEADSGQTAA